MLAQRLIGEVMRSIVVLRVTPLAATDLPALSMALPTWIDGS